MNDPIVDTWDIHNRINLYLLDAVPENALASAIGKSRNVSALFAHMHNVRLMWLKAAAPAELAGLEKLETKTLESKERLRRALEASGTAIGNLLRQAGVTGGKVKGFKPHATAFLGYVISHESHHRGQIGWALKHSGAPLDPKVAFGLWEWGVR
ncbi:MAG: DinB family protein [Isosphaeraceae bacterium]|nr:DinB family protein [Isosphaeraceae bacterium]